MNDRTHVVSESTLHMLKNIPHRIQCDIPDPRTGASKFSVDPSTVDMHPTTSVAVDLNIDRITSLERTVCSNFACCGAQLPDLHALLEHFEEDHVVVLAPNGQRVYPPEGLRSVPLHPVLSLATSPASSRSSSMSPSSPSSPLTPSSSGPSSPSDLSSPTSGPFAKRKSSLSVTPVYTPFTPSLPVDPAYPYPDTSEIVMAHDPSFEFPPDLFPPFSLKSPISTTTISSDEDEEMSDGSTLDAPLSPIPTFIYGTEKGQLLGAIPKHVRSTSSTEKIKSAVKALNSSVASSSTKSSKTKSRYIGTSSNPNLRRREKAYRCPTPRCTKSYLNPNGLKYHMEKGTCKIEEMCEEEELSADSAPVVTPVNEPPAIAPPSASSADVQIQAPPAAAVHAIAAVTTPPSIPNLPNDKAYPSQSSHSPGEIPPHHGAGSYYHHNNLSTVPVQQNHSSALTSSPNVNFNEHNASSDLQGPPLHHTSHQEALSFSIPCAPASSYTPTQHRHSPSESPSPLPHQTESQPRYHYPVPSYPQMVGPNTLLATGYTTYIQSYYQTDRSPNFSTEGCGPSFPPLTAVTGSPHSQ